MKRGDLKELKTIRSIPAREPDGTVSGKSWNPAGLTFTCACRFTLVTPVVLRLAATLENTTGPALDSASRACSSQEVAVIVVNVDAAMIFCGAASVARLPRAAPSAVQ